MITTVASDLATVLLASIVESSDDAIVSKNLNGIVTSWNAAAERLFGYTAEEVIGSPIAILAPPEIAAEMPGILERIRRGERIEHYETRRRRKDGSIVHISLTVSPIRDHTGTIIGASKIARDITQQVETRQRLEMLSREIDHRAKNVLQIVQSIVHLTRAESLEAYIKALEGRIRTLASAHTVVAENEWRGAEVGGLLNDTLAPFRGSVSHLSVNGPTAFVAPGAAQMLAITVHELSTNAVKYGALSVAQGRVSLTWDFDDEGALCFDWVERGGPPARPPSTRGYGMRVIESMLPTQAEGAVAVTWSDEGLSCRLRLPPPQSSRVPFEHARL